MDIAAIASIAKYSALRLSVSTAVTKLVMDQSQDHTQELVKLMEASVNPNLGANIDLQL